MFLPVTPQKQGAIIDLLHNGLHRSLKPLNFFERFRLPHEVESVDDQVPQSTYFVITVLLCFQNLQMHNRTSFSQGVNIWYTPFAQQREYSMRVLHRDGPKLCQFRVENDFGIRNDNWLTSAIVSPICTNFSRNPMTVPKLLDDVAEEIC